MASTHQTCCCAGCPTDCSSCPTTYQITLSGDLSGTYDMIRYDCQWMYYDVNYEGIEYISIWCDEGIWYLGIDMVGGDEWDYVWTADASGDACPHEASFEILTGSGVSFSLVPAP